MENVPWRSAAFAAFVFALGATFDPSLIHEMAAAIGTEARVKYDQPGYDKAHLQYQGLTFWSPNINIFRDPRWGRGQETYGEDPFLAAQFGRAFVSGLQGDDPRYLRAIATPKHFAVHPWPEAMPVVRVAFIGLHVGLLNQRTSCPPRKKDPCPPPLNSLFSV